MSSRRVIDQAGYTLGLVSIDPLVQAELGPLLAEAQAALDALLTAAGKRPVAGHASVEATQHQQAAVRSAMVVRRSLAKRLSSAIRGGVDLPRSVLRVVKSRSPGTLATDVERLVQTATARLAELKASGITSEMLEHAASVARKLREADQHQEGVAWVQEREAVARLHEAKATMFHAIHRIHDRALAVHAHDKTTASRYRLRLMHRGASPPTESPPAAQPA